MCLWNEKCAYRGTLAPEFWLPAMFCLTVTLKEFIVVSPPPAITVIMSNKCLGLTGISTKL